MASSQKNAWEPWDLIKTLFNHYLNTIQWGEQRIAHCSFEFQDKINHLD